MTGEEEKHPLHDLHSRLGRCVLRLQWYEQLLKALVIDHTSGGPISGVEAAREQRIKTYANQSLGMTVGAFTQSVLRLPDARASASDGAQPAVTEPTLTFQFGLGVTNEARGQIIDRLAEFVALRNGLIHKLVETFDLASTEGREGATQHLIDVERRIDDEWDQLRQWHQQMRDTQALVAAFIRSPRFEDMLVNGIRPDGSVDWPRAGIARVLREAAATLSPRDDWVRLDDAVDWIAEQHPDQTPERYGCRTWPDVLLDAKCFDIETRSNGSLEKTTWYRVRQSR